MRNLLHHIISEKRNSDDLASTEDDLASTEVESIPSGDEVEFLVQILSENRSWFLDENDTFSPDGFDAIRVLLLDRFPRESVQKAAEAFLDKEPA